MIALAAPLLALAAVAPSSDGFEGTWETTWGTMEIVLDGSRARGLYGATGSGSFSGEVAGDLLTFRYADSESTGSGRFELAAGGASFTGEYRVDGETEWLAWEGERLAPPPPTFVGLWSTGFGPLRLVKSEGGQIGSGLVGICDSDTGPTRLEGTLEGDRFEFSWSEPADSGTGWFELSEGGGAFTGEWTSGESAGAWSGTRIVPRFGKRWLVVLEAHWEEQLGEEEYGFGDMLASYFEMSDARHVDVRHRYFHDAADLARFAFDVTFLAEPVVLVISTHGTPTGILVDGVEVDPAIVGKALRYADGVDLLHLSGCEMMKGGGDALVREALAPWSPGFPISGYTTVVAWDSSALADMTYLSLVLIRGLAPEAAVEAAHRVAPFTRTEPDDESEFVSLGLVLR